jgi:cytochrome c oxidase cbb3-type subunit 3
MSDPYEDSEVKRGDFAKKKGEVILREHEYDGIQEFDQKLPNWWLFTFYIAIVFFLAYWVIYYHSNTIESDYQKITNKMTEIQKQKEEQLSSALASISNEQLIDEWAQNTERVHAGKAIYNLHCVACHAADLTATMVAGDQKIPLPGLSLVDGEWKYGAQPLDIFKLINDGTPPESSGHNGAKMQAWGQMLKPEEIFEVTAFIIARNPDEFGL